MPLFSPQNTLIVVALADELPRSLLADWRIAYTGVGKVNAAITIEREIAAQKPQVIINFGTAGSLSPNHQGIVEVSQFYQRDMDVRGLGFALGQTPFEGDAPIDFGRPGLSCGTGDQSVTAPPELSTDLVDMEAYALAKSARDHQIDFYCFKYISDQADDAATTSWQDNVQKGAGLFVEMLTKMQSSGGDTRT